MIVEQQSSILITIILKGILPPLPYLPCAHIDPPPLCGPSPLNDPKPMPRWTYAQPDLVLFFAVYPLGMSLSSPETQSCLKGTLMLLSL
jgi:hypothetical protein